MVCARTRSSSAIQPALRSPVLVLGATGLVGQFLLERLLVQSIDVIAVSRQTRPPTPGVTWVTSDLMDLNIEVPSRPEVLFSLANIWLLPPALAKLRSIGIRRLIAFSSTSRFTKERSSVATEREVARRLQEAEAETQAFCEAHEIAWTILRPTVIYAEGRDRSITRLAHLIRRFHALPLSGDGSGMRQPVHADDLAAGAIAAARSPSTTYRAYNLPGGETLSYRSMCERIFEGMNLRPRIITLPPAVWRLGLTLGGPFLPGTTGAMGDRMANDLVFDAGPAKADFGWSARDFHPKF